MGLYSDGRMRKERTHTGAFPQLDVRIREVSEAFRLNVALRNAQWDFQMFTIVSNRWLFLGWFLVK